MVDLLALAHEQCCEARLAADYRRAARRRATARARPPQRPLRRGPAPARHAAQADCACRPCGRRGESFTDRADRDGWPTARLLAALASHEVADRERQRLERHRAEAKLPPGKTLETFDFTLVPAVSKARVRVLASGDVWLGEWANVLLFGPPGKG